MNSRSSSRRRSKPKHFSRPDSAPLNRTARDLWLTALKNGNGYSTENTGMINTNCLSSKRPDANLPYNSTSTYLRQVMGFAKSPRMPDINSPRVASGTPLYKSKEEYYDEVLQLRKEIGALKHENSTVKTKLRRLEEDNLKKEKEITGLLDPGKNEDFRRTLTDRRPDSFVVVSNLKQRIMKLEAQLKSKDHAYMKLKSDLKTTKIEEFHIQVETLYQEILRLQNCNTEHKPVKESGSNNPKMKVLTETILRLNQSLEHLRNENQSLKEDLVESLENTSQNKVLKNSSDNNKPFEITNQIKFLEHRSHIKDLETPSATKVFQNTSKNKTVESVSQNMTNSEADKDLEDMNQHELLSLIAQQKKIIKDLEKEKIEFEDYLLNKPRSNVPGKVPVQGTIMEQLEQLDKQETHLLEELQSLKEQKKNMKSEKNQFKKKAEELELECQKLQLTIKELELNLKLDNKTSHTSVRRRSRASPSPDVRTPRRNSKTRLMSVENTKKLNQEEETHPQTPRVTTNEDMLKLREKYAAKRIQKAWRQHDSDKQAIETLQATLLGHTARKKFLKHSKKDVESFRQSEEENLDKAVELIQSILTAHHSRKKQQQVFRENFMKETMVQR